jgi:hypothetical protein
MVIDVPARTDSENVWPAGTVNALMTIVVHLTAAATSLRLDIVPVHRLAREAALTTLTRAIGRSAMTELIIATRSDEVPAASNYTAFQATFYTVKTLLQTAAVNIAGRPMHA